MFLSLFSIGTVDGVFVSYNKVSKKADSLLNNLSGNGFSPNRRTFKASANGQDDQSRAPRDDIGHPSTVSFIVGRRKGGKVRQFGGWIKKKADKPSFPMICPLWLPS